MMKQKWWFGCWYDSTKIYQQLMLCFNF